jgi:hypothetical protein
VPSDDEPDHTDGAAIVLPIGHTPASSTGAESEEETRMVGTWKPLGNQPPVAVDTMLLLTDGSVMCHDYGAPGAYTPNWYRLVPDAFLDYANGTWQKLTPMPANAPLGQQNGPVDAPLYFASAVLRDGRVFVAGGEYNANPNVDILACSIYDPVADS